MCDIEVVFISIKPDTRIKKLIIDAVNQVLEGEGRRYSALSVILADDKLLHQLNLKSLGVDAPTDVLAYNLGETDDEKIEGEIYISLDRVLAQADEFGMPPDVELLHLVVHGILHLCGVEHDDDVSLRDMTRRGEKYIRKVF